jgi:hypothetical protein
MAENGLPRTFTDAVRVFVALLVLGAVLQMFEAFYQGKILVGLEFLAAGAILATLDICWARISDHVEAWRASLGMGLIVFGVVLAVTMETPWGGVHLHVSHALGISLGLALFLLGFIILIMGHKRYRNRDRGSQPQQPGQNPGGSAGIRVGKSKGSEFGYNVSIGTDFGIDIGESEDSIAHHNYHQAPGAGPNSAPQGGAGLSGQNFNFSKVFGCVFRAVPAPKKPALSPDKNKSTKEDDDPTRG